MLLNIEDIEDIAGHLRESAQSDDAEAAARHAAKSTKQASLFVCIRVHSWF